MSKANRFVNRRSDDQAVSPVIATILMVAITVVLSATVYVWVTGFGGQTTQPARSVSLSSNAPISNAGVKTYTVSAASTGMSWQQLKITLNGVEMAQAATTNATQYEAAHGTTAETGADTIDAGDSITVTSAAGQTLRIVDAQSNAVILTMIVG